jgi:hypothetical protein
MKEKGKEQCSHAQGIIYFFIKRGGSQSLKTQHLAQGHIPNLPQIIWNQKFAGEILELAFKNRIARKYAKISTPNHFVFIFFYFNLPISLPFE